MKKLITTILYLLFAFNLANAQSVSATVNAGGEVIVKKDSSENWAKVYKQKVNGVLKFLWYTTDSLGNKLPRGGQVKNTISYPTLAAAEDAIPSDYSIVGYVPPPDPENPNLAFETGTLPGLVNGTTDIASLNTLGLSVFPATPVTTRGTLNAKLWWQDAALYRGSALSVKALGLASGFDHNRMHTTTDIPVSERMTQNIPPDAYALVSADQAEIEGANEVNYMFGPGGSRRDKLGNVIDIPIVHWDIETAIWSEENAARFIKGFHNAHVATNPNAITIVYGKPTIRTFKPFWRQSQYYYDSDPVISNIWYLYPFMKPVNYQEPMGQIGSYFQNKNIYFNILYSYPSAPLVLTQGMFKKVGSNIIHDSAGERDYVDTGIDETGRGSFSYHWEQNEGHESDPVSPDQGPYKWWRHEASLGVYQGYAHYANALYSWRTLLGQEDVQGAINSAFKTCWMIRSTNESNSWSGNYRPLDRYTTKLYHIMGHMFTHAVMWWSGWAQTVGFSDDGSDSYPAVNEGNPLTDQAAIEGLDGETKNVHLGAERQSLAIYYAIKARNRDYGLYSATDKLCVFTDPLKIQPKAEIIGVGRLNGNYLDLLIAEPRLDTGETLVVTIGNTVTGTTFTRTLNSGSVKSPLWEVFTFTGAGTLTPSQVWIKYTTIKGLTVKKNGKGEDVDTAPFQLYPIAKFDIASNDIKGSTYRNGSGGLQADYDANRVQIQASTHSITYTRDDPMALSTYTIKSVSDGKTWVQMGQTLGSYDNGSYPNNHPEETYGSDIDGEDCIFYLPIQDYDITWTNISSVNITAWVLNPDPGTGAINVEVRIPPGGSYTHRVYGSTMSSQTYYNRALKINNNRTFTTDSLP